LTSLSLRARIGLFALTIPLFMVVAGMVLYWAYQESLERANIERLSAQLYSLLAVAEPSGKNIWLPEQLQEASFNQVQSGLLALVRNENGQVLWQSASALGVDISSMMLLPASTIGQLQVQQDASNDDYLQISLPVRFGEGADTPVLTFEVWQARRLIRQESQTFTTVLGIGLGLLTLALMIIIGVMIRWTLKPINQVVGELGAVEKAQRETISEDYPQELRALTRALNTVLSVERRLRERYRNSLGDLAHSLKTPLAVIRGQLREHSDLHGDMARHIEEQISHMDEVVTYQLKRASSGGSRVWAKPVSILKVVERITNALNKIYRERHLEVALSIDADAGFLGDETDLMEMLGNLIDNAYKYCQSEVSITLFSVEESQVKIEVADDGPGIPPELWDRALVRGVRLDSRPIGQGIGLSVVADLVSSYEGRIHIGDRLDQQDQQRGCSIVIVLPGRLV